MKPDNNRKYFPQVDGLRFVALALIIFFHYGSKLAKHTATGLLGFFAVDLFFAVSGFLVTSILLKPNGKSFGLNYKNFLGRRALRIFPVYYITIAVLWLVKLDAVRSHLLLLLTYTFNYGWVKYNLPFSPVTHFWTLCVEEQFYLFWPPVVLLLKNRIKILTIITIFLIIIGYAQMVFNIIPAMSAYNNAGLLTRMSALGFGALISILSTRNLLPARIMNNLAIEVIMFASFVLAIISGFAGKEIIFGLFAFYLVLKAAFYGFKMSAINTFLTNGTVIWISGLSYGIYAYHLAVPYYFDRCLFEPVWQRIDFNVLGRLRSIQFHAWIVEIPVQTALTIGIAWLSFNYVEMPVMRLKEKYFS
jgi:peptidoglycan/LPS O-acetylase OafA/YrhL